MPKLHEETKMDLTIGNIWFKNDKNKGFSIDPRNALLLDWLVMQKAIEMLPEDSCMAWKNSKRLCILDCWFRDQSVQKPFDLSFSVTYITSDKDP